MNHMVVRINGQLAYLACSCKLCAETNKRIIVFDHANLFGLNLKTL